MLLCSGTPWTPNKCLGFRAVAQTAYIFAMRPNQQHRNNKRKYDKRDRGIAIATIYPTRKNRHKDRKTATGNNRRERNIVKHHKNQDPYAKTKQGDVGLNTRDGADHCRHSFTTLERSKNGENMA